MSYRSQSEPSLAQEDDFAQAAAAAGMGYERVDWEILNYGRRVRCREACSLTLAARCRLAEIITGQ